MDFLLAEFLGTPVWIWATFLLIVLDIVLFDLGVLCRKAHDIGINESPRLSAFCIGLAFGGWIWPRAGTQRVSTPSPASCSRRAS